MAHTDHGKHEQRRRVLVTAWVLAAVALAFYLFIFLRQW